jgi:SNF2 family DNA or RNA helicase
VAQWYKKRGDKVGLYSSSALVKERERIKDGFQDTTNSEGDFVVVDEADRPNFLVGSLELLHKGLQLTRAFRLVLFSPDVDFGKMRQAEKRENRIGQRNEMTIMYVFFNKDSAIDEAILLSAGHIEKMIDRVLKMKAEELDSRGVDREE